VLRRRFGPKEVEVKEEWSKMFNDEYCNLYSSSSINRKIKSRRMRRAGNVTRFGEKKNAYRLSVGKP
jgi:hypothetical protein